MTAPGPPGLNLMPPPGHGGPVPDRDDFRGPVLGDRDDFRSPFPVDRDDTHGIWRNAPWGDQAPPWGWDRPPPPDWDDSRLPPPGAPWDAGPINYWGYQVNPVWTAGSTSGAFGSSGSGSRSDLNP